MKPNDDTQLGDEIRIENWAVVRAWADYYQAPEVSPFQISGQVYGHPNERHEDGKVCVTSIVKEVNGSIVTTQNNTYILGTPSPEFVNWCKENGCHVPTAECPIKVKRRVPHDERGWQPN